MSKDKRNKKDEALNQELENMPAQETLPEEDTNLPLEESNPAEAAQLKADLEAARKQSDEYLTLAQRVQADFDNYRRRNNAARSEAFDEGAAALAKTLLPVVDNLERAIAASENSSDASLRDGVVMVQRQLSEVLEKRGIEAISRLGEKFDPSLENAVMTAPKEEGEPGTVCAVFQKGYRLDKTVLRHAMVKVVEE